MYGIKPIKACSLWMVRCRWREAAWKKAKKKIHEEVDCEEVKEL